MYSIYKEQLYTLALTRLQYFNAMELTTLYHHFSSATELVENRGEIRSVMPEASDRLVEALTGIDKHIERAKETLEFNERYSIKTFTIRDTAYPERLKDCVDAPLALFYKGNASLNVKHCISIVGTRHSTTYGEDVIAKLIFELKERLPDTLIISGLAYGIDVLAHRYSLKYSIPTVGVVAHGLDTVYPASHRHTASQMMENGGLLTEFMPNVRAEKRNFITRNRIVAGMADAVILVESASHGGGLVTMRIAKDYQRECFAYPGKTSDRYSEGCNNLIRDKKATLITCADDLIDVMNWEENTKDISRKGKKTDKSQLELFSGLFSEAGLSSEDGNGWQVKSFSDDERAVIAFLSKNNDQQINVLSIKMNLPVYKLTPILFSLEMKGIVRALAGGIYHLIGG